MDQKLVYKKDQRLEEIENKIAEIFSEAIYSYIIGKGLFKNVNQQNHSLQANQQNFLTKERQNDTL